MTTKPKKRKRLPYRFTRWDHACVSYIHEQLFTNQYPTLESLAQHFRVSRDTIKRNIRHMRDDLHLPIAVSRKTGKRGYYYSEPVSRKIGRTFNEYELMQMMMAHNAVSRIPVKKHQKSFGIEFTKVEQLVDHRTFEVFEEMHGLVQFRPFAPEEIDTLVFLALAEGIREERVVAFAYKKHLAEKPELKRIRPYMFVCAGNSWYLIGWDTEKETTRTYLLSRASNPSVTEETFERPVFNLDEYLKGCFIIMKGSESHDVVVEFNSWAAPYIENRNFVQGQKVSKLPNGGLRISFWLSCLDEVELWVRHWGRNAVVIGPEPLRERMLKTGEWAVQTYGKGDGVR